NELNRYTIVINIKGGYRMFGNLFGPQGEIMWEMAFFLCRFYFHNWANLFSNPWKFFGVAL
uniref:hypothetical protein n=1 Tax=Streptococcus parasuis TaxID=1501662 RepID=UPI0028B075F8